MDSKNTVVYIRVKSKRPSDFTDPPVFDWNLEKEKRLWNFLSKLHDPDEEIDWDLLSEGLDTPIYFLKRRCYELFTKHLELLKQQIDRKNRTISESDDDSNHSLQIKKEVEFLNQMPVRTPGTIHEEPNPDIEEDTWLNKGDKALGTEDITKRAIDHLKSSKILNFNQDFYEQKQNINGTQEYLNGDHEDNSGSELSSNIGVSKSTLEEALMDKLQI
ncbi:Atg29p [Nakaseomyces bracarensis]|uniref:Atg29p n=1 Tax=Nakaseomyces bracarensis TaxID=273131 RepID=UPI003871AD99